MRLSQQKKTESKSLCAELLNLKYTCHWHTALLSNYMGNQIYQQQRRVEEKRRSEKKKRLCVYPSPSPSQFSIEYSQQEPKIGSK